MKKVSIILNNASMSRPGYDDIHIQQFALSEDKYDKIFLGNCISYLEYNSAINLIIQCLDKLNTGGILSIQNYDVVAVCEKVYKGQIDFNVANEVLSKKNSHHSIFSIIESISQYNKFRIYKKDIENVQFILQLVKVDE